MCTGEVVHPGTSSMVAQARIVDGSGRVIALAGCTCRVRTPR
jgi:acyl-coenzyme A thioesterase PaaI-like protein